MRRDEGAQTPYEVYCYHCQVTFAVGTTRCVHCGNRLSRAGRDAAAEPLSATNETRSEAPLEPDDFVEEEEEEGAMLMARRFGGLGIWGLLAIGAVISNMCQGG